MSNKVQAIYHAPEGDSKVIEVQGKTFFDGQSIDLDDEQDAGIIFMLENNRLFELPGHEGHAASLRPRDTTKPEDANPEDLAYAGRAPPEQPEDEPA